MSYRYQWENRRRWCYCCSLVVRLMQKYVRLKRLKRSWSLAYFQRSRDALKWSRRVTLKLLYSRLSSSDSLWRWLTLTQRRFYLCSAVVVKVNGDMQGRRQTAPAAATAWLGCRAVNTPPTTVIKFAHNLNGAIQRWHEPSFKTTTVTVQ